MDDTVVLATVVAAKNAKPGQDFFPLTVDYVESSTPPAASPAASSSEGRPTEKETLTSRLIDRPIRPLFPDGFYNEVQVIAQVVSLNPEVDADIPAMIAASAALAIAGIPFAGPIGACRVGYADGQYILNPTATQLQTSQMNLVVAGTETAVLMVESEARELPEDVMLGGVVFGHTQMQAAITAINELVDVAGKPEWDWQAAGQGRGPDRPRHRNRRCQDRGSLPHHRQAGAFAALSAIADEVHAAPLTADGRASSTRTPSTTSSSTSSRKVVRGRILSGEPRIDGRDTRTVRPIDIRVGVLPRTHGSALFTRGETRRWW